MGDMKGRLYIDVTTINGRVIDLLRKHLGCEETSELIETDCFVYLMRALLTGGWLTKKFKGCNLGIVSTEHIFQILEDYMDDTIDSDDWQWEQNNDLYHLVSTAISSDIILMRSVVGTLSIITPKCVNYTLQPINKTVWVLQYVERTKK